MDEVRIAAWKLALTRGIATRRTTLARLLGAPLGLALLHAGLLESDAKGKKGKKKKKGKGKNKGGKTPPPTSPPPGGGNGAALDAEESAFLTQINAYRAANGRAALTANAQLNAAADGHSVDMATRNYFEHDTPEGITYEQRIVSAGYTNATAHGENILAGHETASAALLAWQNSPPHNKNMLSPDFAEIGIGRAFNANSKFGWYWTTNFGKK